jgi:hypothetical protein
MPIVVKVKTRTQGENNSDVKKKDRQSFSLPEPQRLQDQLEMEIPNQDFPSWAPCTMGTNVFVRYCTGRRSIYSHQWTICIDDIACSTRVIRAIFSHMTCLVAQEARLNLTNIKTITGMSCNSQPQWV